MREITKTKIDYMSLSNRLLSDKLMTHIVVLNHFFHVPPSEAKIGLNTPHAPIFSQIINNHRTHLLEKVYHINILKLMIRDCKEINSNLHLNSQACGCFCWSLVALNLVNLSVHHVIELVRSRNVNKDQCEYKFKPAQNSAYSRRQSQ